MIEFINDFLWGYILLIFLLGIGLIISFRIHFFQILKFPYILKNTLISLFKKQKKPDKEKAGISQFQAVCTSLAATMGTGNIAGVATAITLGGAGAIFWMWISALIGMALVYAENNLSAIYRKKNNGEWLGGPMAYLENGAGKKNLAVLFAVFCILASFGMGNMTQVNSISSSISDCFGISDLTTGIITAILAFAVISGGIKRIGKVSVILLPFLSAAYIIAALLVIIKNRDNLSDSLHMIFSGAFGLKATGGGICGEIVRKGLSTGLRRGVFSNEAGLGSSALLHCSAENATPKSLGMWAIFEVFTDTIVCCTLTALAILTSKAFLSEKDGVLLVTESFKSLMGNTASVFMSFSIALFAFATLISWFYCGESSVRYIFGKNGIAYYKILFLFFILLGATAQLRTVWAISDIFNGLMAIPNLIGIFLLRKKIKN